jgi:predicted dehydrogenase
MMSKELMRVDEGEFHPLATLVTAVRSAEFLDGSSMAGMITHGSCICLLVAVRGLWASLCGMSKPFCRWGFLSTASIGRKNWQAVRDAGNGVVSAVASRNITAAQSFISECQAQCPFEQVPLAFGSYEELIDCPEVDAVYLPLPTGLRKEWVLRAARAGKHVLIEKPAADSAMDVEEMMAACQQAGVQLMDGVMYVHTQRMMKMRQVIDDGAIGEVRRVSAQFSFHGGEEFARTNIRTHSVLESMGALGDLGWYTARFILWAMNYEMPISLTAQMHSTLQHPDSPEPVPAELSAELVFKSGASASMHCSFVAEHCQLAMVSGTKGYLSLRDFVLPFAGTGLDFEVLNSAFVADGCRFDMHAHRTSYAGDEVANNSPGSPEANLFHAFSANVIAGAVDPLWPEILLKTQRVLDACLHSARHGGLRINW